MNVDPKDDLDRAIDETLASMLHGEPRHVSGAGVRRAAGESGRPSVPAWLAVAAVLIAALGVVFSKDRAPIARAPVSVARSTEHPVSVEVPARLAPPGTAGVAPARRARSTQTTTEARYEGLPRLTIAWIDLPEPLSTSRLAADPIQIPSIDIAPLSVSSLWNEQEHK